MIVIKRIQQLPVHLANQIAAGEVIERPASVLKELLENSLDAESTQIEISVEKAGVGLIKVQDNGVGICKEDLKLALMPHATSKILSSSDLEGIISYGFRGEALASISAVSRLKLSSATAEQDLGWAIQMEGRESSPVLMPIAKRIGTLIEVRDLFYNTPARRKFLRSERTETSYTEEVFKRIALSQPQVAFKFERSGTSQKRLPACKSLEAHTKRVALLCGQSFINDAYYIEAEVNGLRLTGWIGSAKAMRAQNDLQYFYVNKRIVRDKVVMHAVRQAYQEVALEGRYPAYVLYFELDPATVDVNVHPTKHEVRFREARTVHAFLTYAVQEGLKEGKSASLQLPLKRLENHIDKEDFDPLKIDNELPETINHFLQKPIQQKSQLEKPFFVLKDQVLFAELDSDCMVIDLRLARKYLIKLQLLNDYQQDRVSKRALMIPKSIIVSPKALEQETHRINWSQLGFEISQAGENLILVRTVPMVFGVKVEQLDTLMPKLLMLSDLNSCIDLITSFVIENEKLSHEELRQLVMDVVKLEGSKENPRLGKAYKRVSLEQLKNLLF